MKIKRCQMSFNNMISLRRRGNIETLFENGQRFRNEILKAGLYTTSPLIYQIDDTNGPEDMDMTLYMALNMGLTLEENSDFAFEKELVFEDGLLIRHYDEEESFKSSYELLESAAEALDVTLDPNYYHIDIKVYDETITDIFAPIVEDRNHD